MKLILFGLSENNSSILERYIIIRNHIELIFNIIDVMKKFMLYYKFLLLYIHSFLFVFMQLCNETRKKIIFIKNSFFAHYVLI